MDANKLLENKQLQYYLAGLGQTIGGQGSVGDALGGMAQQTIAAQNQAKVGNNYISMLRDLLSGGAKMSMDKDNVSIKAPTGAFGQNSDGMTKGIAASPTANPQVNQELLSLLNPSNSQPQMSGSDVVGLSTEDMSRALGGALDVNKLIETKISDQANRILQERALGIQEGQLGVAQSKNMLEWQKHFREAPLEVPGMGRVDKETWDSLDTKTKAYSYYAFNAKQNNESVMSFNEWDQQTDDPMQKQLYDLAKIDPEFDKWLFKLQESGATKISLGEKVEQREKFGEVDAKLFVKSPEFQPKVVQDLSKERSYKMPTNIEEVMKTHNLTYEKAKSTIQHVKVLQEMDKRIRQAYKDEVVERRKDGWYVGGELVVRNPYGN